MENNIDGERTDPEKERGKDKGKRKGRGVVVPLCLRSTTPLRTQCVSWFDALRMMKVPLQNLLLSPLYLIIIVLFFYIHFPLRSPHFIIHSLAVSSVPA